MPKNRTAHHWHLVRELLHSGTQLTQSLRDSGSWIDTPSQNVDNYCIVQLSVWVQSVRAHQDVMGRILVLCEVVTEVSAAVFPIN